MMTFRLLLPGRALYEGPAAKVVADGVEGSRGFLPRHADFVMPLVPGVLTCTDGKGEDVFFAVHGGVLVKKGSELTVVARRAVKADALDRLPEDVLQTFAAEDEQTEAADRAAARLETVLLREFLELHK